MQIADSLEACAHLSNTQASLLGARHNMDLHTIESILLLFNESQIRYALVGGMAMGCYAEPRAIDLLELVALWEDLPSVLRVFGQHRAGGTATAGRFELDGTFFDVQPANSRAQIATVENAVEAHLQDVRIRIASLRDLLLLKVWSANEGTDDIRYQQDQADVVTLLTYQGDKLSPSDLEYVGTALKPPGYPHRLSHAYNRTIDWLNECLRKLALDTLQIPAD